MRFENFPQECKPEENVVELQRIHSRTHGIFLEAAGQGMEQNSEKNVYS